MIKKVVHSLERKKNKERLIESQRVGAGEEGERSWKDEGVGGGQLRASFEMCISVREGEGEDGVEVGMRSSLILNERLARLFAARARSPIEGDQLHHQFFARGHIDSSQAVGSDMTAGYVWAWLPG